MEFLKVPVWVPLLFIIYASEMFSVFDNRSQAAHGFADDTQLYCSLNPKCLKTQEIAMEKKWKSAFQIYVTGW